MGVVAFPWGKAYLKKLIGGLGVAVYPFLF